MKIYFLRHGESEHDKDGMLRPDEIHGDGLTDDGETQVEEAAKVLAGLGIVRIISSDTLRSKQSTGIVSKELGIGAENINYDKDLREMGVGKLAEEGKSLADLKQVYAENRQGEYGAETYEEMHARTCRVLNRYEATVSEAMENGNGSILFSGHGHFNSMLRYCICEGTDKPFDKQRFKIHDAQATNASVMVIDMDYKQEFRKAEFIHGGTRKEKQAED